MTKIVSTNRRNPVDKKNTGNRKFERKEIHLIRSNIYVWLIERSKVTNINSYFFLKRKCYDRLRLPMRTIVCNNAVEVWGFIFLSHNEIRSLNKVGYYHPCEETISDYNWLGKIVWQWGKWIINSALSQNERNSLTVIAKIQNYKPKKRHIYGTIAVFIMLVTSQPELEIGGLWFTVKK